ncbi:MAG TPA: hypothetical protein VN805_00310 [Caulobacteraceae bacterium]|nr:hypothetical protein [Caulobacteraceae bacterium]
MADRGVRNLANLERTASTARVLNLWALKQRKGDDPDYRAHRLFKNATLNASIILKHKLRANELELFTIPRHSATKILVPIEGKDLRMGARFAFIGQKGFRDALHHTFGVDIDEDSADHRVLRILDEAPTLDPFLVREQLRRNGFTPARCYFDLSEADSRRMFRFAQSEIETLVRLSMGGSENEVAQAVKLTQKILANSADAELDPLRRTLQLDAAQFQEGVFCWKAFLYYKWQLTDLLPRVGAVLRAIQTIRPHGPMSDDTKIYLSSASETLCRALTDACRNVKMTLEIYDVAYRNLTEQNDPLAFRDFLLKAPTLFNALGEKLGGIEHIVSFWRFRFADESSSTIAPDALADIFKDFENGLGVKFDERPLLNAPEIIAAA